MHNGSVYTGCYDSLQNISQITISTHGEKGTKSSPNAIKMSKMDSNAQVINMKLLIHINDSPFIIHLLEIHSSIRNNQHYHSIHQCSGEMVIVCSLIITFPYNHLIFWPDTFWELIKYNIDIITISNGQWKSLPIRNH